ncbi:hypothetical protein [Aneurinibacillus aneurinilyticus]|uniref:hypothetical protein n=1 Tax=Aneurinibacillus aneurinilyticus TaxID=1391 RepID=UPI0023F3BE58|nr:hypothetical protein [Aneurinibacillus aneurinilyticus]
MTIIKALENTLESLHLRAKFSNRNTLEIKRSIHLVERYLSDYMKWGGAHGNG